MSKILFNEKADHKWFSEGEMLQQFSKWDSPLIITIAPQENKANERTIFDSVPGDLINIRN